MKKYNSRDLVCCEKCGYCEHVVKYNPQTNQMDLTCKRCGAVVHRLPVDALEEISDGSVKLPDGKILLNEGK
jgi:PHP family Zn ribbon phosphoesterase